MRFSEDKLDKLLCSDGVERTIHIWEPAGAKMVFVAIHDTFTPDEVRTMVAAKTLAEREGTPEDVANAVLFLATDNSSYINGESIEINSGLYFI